MRNGNGVVVSGNLTNDPELRFTASGQAVANFGLAYNNVWYDKQTDEKKESTSFFRVSVWRDLAEHVAESLSKGDRVWVEGSLEQRSWETDDGDKRSVVEITANDVGPSLMWATAEVHKAQRAEPGNRRDNGGSGGSGGARDNGNRRETAGAGSGRGSYGYGEEPF